MKQSSNSQQFFMTSLMKVQNNLINSFKLLQDNLNRNIQQLHLKTSLMEDKFLQIFHAKQKVIIKLNTSLESVKNNIGIIEDSLVNLSNSKDTYAIVQTHFNIKMQKFTRQERQKMNQLQAQISHLESKILSDIIAKKNNSNIDSIQNKLIQLETKIQQDNYKPISNYNSNGEVSSIKQELKQINKLVTKIIEDSNRHQRKIQMIEENSFRSTPHHHIIDKINQIQVPSTPKYQTSDYKITQKRQFQLPNKQSEIMEVGLKGLRKSKQKRDAAKQQTVLLQKDKPLLYPVSPPRKKKQLPPLMKQSNLKNKKHFPSSQPSQSEQYSEISAEFFVDEDGHVIDTEGNYVRDQNGNILFANDLQQDEDYS